MQVMLTCTGHSPAVFAKATRAVGEEIKFFESVASCEDQQHKRYAVSTNNQ